MPASGRRPTHGHRTGSCGPEAVSARTKSDGPRSEQRNIGLCGTYPGLRHEHRALPISSSLRDELAQLVERYDASLNWDYPPDPGPWREPEWRAFNTAVRRVLDQLRAELQWVIADHFEEVHEDLNLDRYLADPVSFQR